MRVFVFDTETTGLDPRKHSIVEIAAYSFDLMRPEEPTHLFHRYVYPENMVWTAYCLNLHKDLLVQLIGKTIPYDHECTIFTDFDCPKAVPADKLFRELQTWHTRLGYLDRNNKVASMIGAGKNFATFDLPFIQNLPGYTNVFKHRSLDPAMAYLEPQDEVPPELKECKKRAVALGGVFDKMEVAHTAVEDVMDVVELLKIAYLKRKWVPND